MNDLLKSMRENREFLAVMEEAEKKRPIVPQFSLCQTKDEQEMVIESIKYHSALRNGFDLLYQYLTGKAPTNLKEVSHGRARAGD